MINITVAAAFLAGIVSFLAPCVLPILPGFLAYISGASLADARHFSAYPTNAPEGRTTSSKRKEVFLNSVFFVLGFSSIFALLGVLLNTLLEAVAYDAQTWLSRIGGAIIIFFGLYLTGLFHIPFFEREHKFNISSRFRTSYPTSFIFGAAFAAGWTPCVGPALGAILGLAASFPGNAFYLLLAYALGLGIPFLILGLFVSQASAFIKKFQPALRYINIIFGILLIALGILIFTEQLNRLANFEFLNRWLPQ